MLSRLRRSLRRFFNKSRQINHEPINKVSLIVIIIVDLFILFNVFAGLDDISRWPLSPQQAYPCQSSWQLHRQSTAEDKDYNIIREAITPDDPFFQQGQLGYAQLAEGHLGRVSEVCLAYEQAQTGIDTPENKQLAKRIK